jgi:hypothetical protein
MSWGDNNYSLSVFPVSLSSVTSVAAGAYRGVPLTTNIPVLVPGSGTNVLCFANRILTAIQ